MKKFFAWMLISVLLLASLSALADEKRYVMCISCTVDGKPYSTYDPGTQITAVAELPDDGQVIDYWQINGSRSAEYDGMEEITLTVTEDLVIKAVGKYDPNRKTETAAEVAEIEVEGEGVGTYDELEETESDVRVTAYGCTLQYLDAKGKGAGPAYTELDFTGPWINPVTETEEAAGSGSFRVTVDNASNSAIDYWVIDGIRYDFNVKVKRFNVYGLDRSMTIEVVYKDAMPRTLSHDKGTGTLIVRTTGAKMSFINEKKQNKGGYFTEFDFSGPFKNDATKSTEPGGSVTLRVVGKNKPAVWYMNGVAFKFSSTVEHFVVWNLNRSMTYEGAKK